MANFFKSYADILADTNNTTLLTCASNSVYIVNSIIVSNKHATTDSTIDITITDTSETTTVNILQDYAMQAGLSEELLERPLILQHDDILKAQAADASVFDLYISYLDRSRNV
jgi:hypothetical protein